ADGQITRVRDVARVELAARDYSMDSKLDGQPNASLGIFQLPGSNSIETSDAVHATMRALKERFPPGLDYRIVFDTTGFTRESIDEVSGAVVAVGLVLSAVFIPTAFISGITGQFYRQFALTIAVSTIISAFNSLTLSPALCAILLKSPHARADWFTRLLNTL